MTDKLPRRGRPSKNKPSLDVEFVEKENIIEEATIVEEREDDDVSESFNESEALPNESDLKQHLKSIGMSESEFQDEIPSTNYNPLRKSVIQRGYEGGERVTEQSQVHVDNILPKSDFSHQKSNSFQSQDNFSSQEENIDYEEQAREDAKRKKLEKEKRKNVEKTADVILASVQNILPLPFQTLARYRESHIQKLELADEINLDLVIKEDGTTVGGYIEEHNLKVSEILSLSDEDIETIKEPLVDVLMEKEIELTPTQRLLVASGNILIKMGITSLQLMQMKRTELEQFKIFHETKKSTNMKNNNPIFTPEPIVNRPPVDSVSNEKTNVPIVETEVVKDSLRQTGGKKAKSKGKDSVKGGNAETDSKLGIDSYLKENPIEQVD